MTLLSKKEVNYGPSSDPACHRCQICIHFGGKSPMHTCQIVEGIVEHMDSCDRFDKDLIRDALYIMPKGMPTVKE